MANVVGINKDDDIISTLKVWLKAAKEGRMTTLCAIVVIDGEFDTEMIGTASSLETLALTHLLANEVTMEIMQSGEEGE